MVDTDGNEWSYCLSLRHFNRQFQISCRICRRSGCLHQSSLFKGQTMDIPKNGQNAISWWKQLWIALTARCAVCSTFGKRKIWQKHVQTKALMVLYWCRGDWQLFQQWKTETCSVGAALSLASTARPIMDEAATATAPASVHVRFSQRSFVLKSADSRTSLRSLRVCNLSSSLRWRTSISRGGCW